METPVQIAFEDLAPSDALEALVRDETSALERYFDGIVTAHVTIAEPHRHQRRGRLFRVKLRLVVPGEVLVVDHEHGRNAAHADAHQAVREAFHAARRELEDYVRRLREQVKDHEHRPRGRIVRLVPWDDCGFIETADGREVYFHRNSLLHERFEALRVGDLVTYIEEPAEKGPNAKSVRVMSHQPGERSHGAEVGEAP
jgi:cold shock CspA family protein/ribosome-associated translation inhibitor RaiA